MSYVILESNGEPRRRNGKEILAVDVPEGVATRSVKDPGKRLVEVITSSDSKDRDGDRINQMGIDHSQHMKTRAVLYAHDYGRQWLPIGKLISYRTEKRKGYVVTLEVHQFNPPGTYEVSDAAWKMRWIVPCCASSA